AAVESQQALAEPAPPLGSPVAEGIPVGEAVPAALPPEPKLEIVSPPAPPAPPPQEELPWAVQAEAAPPVGSVPTGFRADEPAVPMGAPVGEPEEAPPLPRLRREVKYGPKFWLGCAFGLLMWIIAGVLAVVLIVNWMKPSRPAPTRPIPIPTKAKPVS